MAGMTVLVSSIQSLFHGCVGIWRFVPTALAVLHRADAVSIWCLHGCDRFRAVRRVWLPVWFVKSQTAGVLILLLLQHACVQVDIWVFVGFKPCTKHWTPILCCWCFWQEGAGCLSSRAGNSYPFCGITILI